MMGKLGKAIAVGTLYFIFIVFLPLLFVSMVSFYIAKNGGDPSRYFDNTSLYILIFGMGTTIFASLGAYYEKGNAKRLALTLTSSVLLALWGYFFIGSMNIYYEGDTYAYEVLVPGIALILAISLSFKAIYRIVEYLVYRKEHLGGRVVSEPEEMPVRRNGYEREYPATSEEEQYMEGDDLYF